MIRWDVLKQLSKFTYFLETDEEDGYNDQMGGIQAVDQVHAHPGEDGME
jgi:hypothetical protein